MASSNEVSMNIGHVRLPGQSGRFARIEARAARGARSSVAEDAELVVVNTCSVTASADQGARQTIRRIVRDNPSARIVVTGCYATRRPDEISQLPNVAARRVERRQGRSRRFSRGRDACA